MTATRMTKLRKALAEPNLSISKRAILQTACDSLGAMAADPGTSLVGLVASMFDATPSECLTIVDRMLASSHAFDPFFFYETQQALGVSDKSQNALTKAFVMQVGNQTTFQTNLFIFGALELTALLFATIGYTSIDNAALRLFWCMMMTAILAGVTVGAGVYLQDNENIILLQRNAINQVAQAAASPVSTTASLLSSWLFRGVTPIDTLAQRVQAGVVHAPRLNASAEDHLKFATSIACKWTPVSLYAVYNGLISFAKQSTALPAESTAPRSFATLMRR